MKKRSKLIFAILSTTAILAGCTPKDGDASVSDNNTVVDLSGSFSGGETATTAPDATDAPEEDDSVPEGMYRSELTNEIISKDIENQRPVAVMVDNETYAYPHMGLNQADVVYEIMNSTANGRITRLMVLVKDWKNIEQLGSIRSARPTNFMLAGDWNAILVHDGGPFYINDFIARKYTNNLSGGFARFSNGKATEFTEYLTSENYTNPSTGKSYDGLISRVEKGGYSEEYNDYYNGREFTFVKGGNRDLDGDSATDIKLPFQHTSSELKYNEETGTYDYYTYGDAHIDPLDDNKVLSFENVIIEKADFTKLDDNGYLIYNVLQPDPWEGYYCTNGKMIEITWQKMGEDSPTYYFEKESGMPLELNTGKTYITLVPDDQWKDVKID